MIFVALFVMCVAALILVAIVAAVADTPSGEGCEPTPHTLRQPRCRRHSRQSIHD